MKFNKLVGNLVNENYTLYTREIQTISENYEHLTPFCSTKVRIGGKLISFKYRINIHPKDEEGYIIDFIMLDSGHKGSLIIYSQSEEIDWEPLDGVCDIDDEEGWDALHWAMHHSEKDNFESLIQHGKKIAASQALKDLQDNPDVNKLFTKHD